MKMRRKYSACPHMKKCINARKVYLAGGGHLNLKEFWSREKILEKYGISYRSYWNYATDKVPNRLEHFKASVACWIQQLILDDSTFESVSLSVCCLAPKP